MSRWRRSRRAAVGGRADASSFSLEDGERLLVSARTTDDEWVAGTNQALHLPGGTVLGWHRVDTARWVDDAHALEVVTLPEGTAPAQTHRVSIPSPGLLPELVRERVTSSVVVSERVALVGRKGARIVARRVPGDDGVRWSVIYDPGIDRSDPVVQTATREAVARLQSQFGV